MTIIFKNRGFTLIELLVTIAVIGVTAFVVIPSLRNFSQSQSLNSISGDILRSSRKALASAQSGTNCSGGTKSVSWSLIFTSSGYQLQALCGTPSSNSLGSVESKSISPATISLSCSSGGLGPAPVIIGFNSSTYSSQTVSLPCTDSGANFIIKLSDTQNSTCVQFTPGGVISENEKCTTFLASLPFPTAAPATPAPSNPPPVTPTNLVANPDAEANILGWTGYHATLTRDTTTANSGTASFKITNNLSGSTYDTMDDNPATVTNPSLGKEYLASGWVKADTASVGKTAQIILRQTGGTSVTSESSSNSSFALSTTWQKISVSATINAADRTALEVYFVQNGTLNNVMYIDDISVTLVLPAVNNENVACGYGSFVSQTSSAVFPDACWRPYADTAPFNQSVPSIPKINVNSDAIVNAWFTRQMDDMDIGLSTSTSAYKDYNHPTYFSKSTDPLYTITCTKYGGACAISGAQIRIPVGAKPANGADGHLAVIDQSTDTEYDLWQSSVPSGTGGPLNISWGGKTNIKGDGLNSDGTAAWFGEAGGNIRASEWSAGVIDHALFIVVKCDSGQIVSPGLGHGTKCGTTSNTLTENTATAAPMGARFFLAMTDTDIDATGLASWKRILMKAMAHYGMYVGDTGGTNWEIKTESGFTYTSFGYSDPLVNFAQNNGAIFYQDFYVFKFPELANYTNRIYMIDP